MAETKSCLVEKLSRYAPLSERDLERLATLEEEERPCPRGSDVHRAGDRNGDLFVLKAGWAFSFTNMPDGRRQIVTVHHPGDVIGFPDIAFRNATTTLRCVDDVTLCPFPKSALSVILRESPRLSALMLSIALRDQVVFIDLLRAMGRMSARERIAHMLLDFRARLRMTDPAVTDRFRLPLTQQQIADYLGITNVYVSRTMIQMEDEGEIVRSEGHITLRDASKLERLTDFCDRYADMDTSWFPDT
ncbi:Nitrogen fixation regulation protein FixK [Jannaschia seosinensis]|uniref:Nitrogen fixation regulation protein FixK n=1 Tax=Jannaschia seosinensis TaxID=313367 RepID=A0A0M7BD66_9RHOB|nr:Crp/Fnr family transcriptional regulator [Jannaschia seosinensis]CUH40680.1 Nitrogen fixation regulation protein FixK [Jannaschia seosinensis]